MNDLKESLFAFAALVLLARDALEDLVFLAREEVLALVLLDGGAGADVVDACLFLGADGANYTAAGGGAGADVARTLGGLWALVTLASGAAASEEPGAAASKEHVDALATGSEEAVALADPLPSEYSALFSCILRKNIR